MKKGRILLSSLIATGVLLGGGIAQENVFVYGKELPNYFPSTYGTSYRPNQEVNIKLPDELKDIKGLTFKIVELPEGLTFNEKNLTITGNLKKYLKNRILIDYSAPDYTPGSFNEFLYVAPENDGIPTLKNLYFKQNEGNININLDNDFTRLFDIKVTGLPEGVVFNKDTYTISGTPKELGTHIIEISGNRHEEPNPGESLVIGNNYIIPKKIFTITVVEKNDPIVVEKIVYVDKNTNQVVSKSENEVSKENNIKIENTTEQKSENKARKILPKTSSVK